MHTGISRLRPTRIYAHTHGNMQGLQGRSFAEEFVFRKQMDGVQQVRARMCVVYVFVCAFVCVGVGVQRSVKGVWLRHVCVFDFVCAWVSAKDLQTLVFWFSFLWHCVRKISFCYKCHCIEPTEHNHLSVCTRTFRNDSQNSSLRLFNVVNLVQPLRQHMLELLYTDVHTRVCYREIVYTKTFLYGLCIYLCKVFV